MVRWLFTQRNKKLSNALVPFLRNTSKVAKEDAEKISCTMPFHEKRVREMAPEVFGEIANALVR
jgi:16S rRNA A1518/A1519 N6-dimethyltransferase RsmA/KsgA/DIM1 with predicted DNA glycosylase/AP lyase activity